MIDDDKLLEYIYKLLDINIEEPDDIYILSDKQNDAINEAREEIKNGEFLTDKDSNSEIDEWLE